MRIHGGGLLGTVRNGRSGRVLIVEICVQKANQRTDDRLRAVGRSIEAPAGQPTDVAAAAARGCAGVDSGITRLRRSMLRPVVIKKITDRRLVPDGGEQRACGVGEARREAVASRVRR